MIQNVLHLPVKSNVQQASTLHKTERRAALVEQASNALMCYVLLLTALLVTIPLALLPAVVHVQPVIHALFLQVQAHARQLNILSLDTTNV